MIQRVTEKERESQSKVTSGLKDLFGLCNIKSVRALGSYFENAVQHEIWLALKPHPYLAEGEHKKGKVQQRTGSIKEQKVKD